MDGKNHDFLFVPQKKKNNPGKIVGSDQKYMIINLYKDLKERDPSINYKDIVKTLMISTGIGRGTICKTLSEYKRTGIVTTACTIRNKESVFDKMDDVEKRNIRKKIHSLWLERELPTLDKILRLNGDLTVNISRTTLFRLLKSMKFIYVKMKKNSILTERNDIINWRRNYIHDIRNYRKQKRPIYYLDETCVNASDYIEVGRQDVSIKSEPGVFSEGLSTVAIKPTGRDKRLIVLHIGSDKGFVPNGLLCFESKIFVDYHDEMNGVNFKEWFKLILPNLERNSVIVLDNASYHSVKLEKIPTSDWKKKDILTWLESKGERFDRSLLKAQLLIRVKQIKNRFNAYVIDKIAQKAGHTVLRLPSNHNEFNPIELAWAMIKRNMKQINTTNKIQDVKNLLSMAIDRVKPQHWCDFIKLAIDEEDKIWQVDDIMDEIIDTMEPCNLTITDETLSDSSSDE